MVVFQWHFVTIGNNSTRVALNMECMCLSETLTTTVRLELLMATSTTTGHGLGTSGGSLLPSGKDSTLKNLNVDVIP